MLRHLALVFCIFAAVSLPARAAIETNAEHALLMDASTGQVLWQKDGMVPMPPASMSKLMTIELLFQRLKDGRVKLTDTFPVSERAWRTGGSKMFLKVDDRVSVEDLIRGLLIQSGNDAAICLAEGLGGSEEAFVKAMNVRAKEIGLTNSHFVTASGLPDPDHYSTARDLAVLAYRIITDFPEYYHFFSEKEFTYNKIHQPNRDLLLGKDPQEVTGPLVYAGGYAANFDTGTFLGGPCFVAPLPTAPRD